MIGTVFEHHSRTHGYHKWVVIKDVNDSKYCICAIISSKQSTHSIKILPNKCDSVRKVSFIQFDNLLSIKKEIIINNKTELLCSSLLNELKIRINKFFK